MIDFQSSCISACVLDCGGSAAAFCPSGTFENSQQHARVIYGWVHRLIKIKSPAGTTEILPRLIGLKYRVPDITSPSAPLRLCVRNPCPPVVEKKGRNYKTNPIFIASRWRPKTTEGKISNPMISETHQLLRHAYSVRTV
jgi:hypothetical protein